MYCRCKQKPNDGWTKRSDDLWVHPVCGLPHKYVIEKALEGKVPVNVPDLNLFQHGEHHNELWTVKELLYGRDDGASCASWITDYAWTDETVTGSESGRVARVWKLKSAE